jgi:hypothetical protein
VLGVPEGNATFCLLFSVRGGWLEIRGLGAAARVSFFFQLKIKRFWKFGNQDIYNIYKIYKYINIYINTIYKYYI